MKVSTVHMSMLALACVLMAAVVHCHNDEENEEFKDSELWSANWEDRGKRHELTVNGHADLEDRHETQLPEQGISHDMHDAGETKMRNDTVYETTGDEEEIIDMMKNHNVNWGDAKDLEDDE